MTRTQARTHTYDLAQLAGGVERVADTAVVALLARGRLLVDGGGLLRVAGSAPAHPVEAAVLDAVGPRPRPRRSALTVRALVQDDPRVGAVAVRLEAEGLLRRNPWAVLSRSWPARVRTPEGRRVLAEARQQPGIGEDVRVALDGVAAMADQTRRRLVFGAAPGRAQPGGRARRSDGPWSSSTSGSFLTWGGGDGGSGGWGGDGGGCGGGDGGGGGC
ncbi:TIGR04222 domain-containing membrane protein [Modestobacter sp. SSW1-42]|uniref:TIGR04222 domain-containing membrane protein n=1 Tax=Modestobacter sp. SSW1-42 TaxID=596372 RepID=UPI0039885D2D